MPVRSLSSCVLKWPDRNQVDRAARIWANEAAECRRGLLRVGYFGSYARGQWGVGSDLDLVVVVEKESEPFFRRSLHWDLGRLPVPAELLVYTEEEWSRLRDEGGRFARTLAQETVWIYCR